MLELNNLVKIYGNKKVVNNLSLKVSPGEIFGFLGPNGAGKTTTLKMITGLIKPTSGTIIINGIDTSQEGNKAKKFIGYVADVPYLYDLLTGHEYLELIGSLWEVKSETLQDNLNKYLTLFGLTNQADQYIKNYSHGMKQKIALCGALIHNPSILILDEPLASLDPPSAHEIKKFLLNFAKAGGTVFFSTHLLEVAERLCTRLGIINNGSLVATGSLDELKENATSDVTLEEIFIKFIKAC